MPALTDDQLVDALIAGHGRTARDLATELHAPCAKVAAKLDALHAKGKVRRELNGRSVAYWSL